MANKMTPWHRHKGEGCAVAHSMQDGQCYKCVQCHRFIPLVHIHDPCPAFTGEEDESSDV